MQYITFLEILKLFNLISPFGGEWGDKRMNEEHLLHLLEWDSFGLVKGDLL